MVELKIKKRTLPERCEICHKSDRFDQQRNYCDRCSGTTVTIERVETKEPVHRTTQERSIWEDNEVELDETGKKIAGVITVILTAVMIFVSLAKAVGLSLLLEIFLVSEKVIPVLAIITLLAIFWFVDSRKNK